MVREEHEARHDEDDPAPVDGMTAEGVGPAHEVLSASETAGQPPSLPRGSFRVAMTRCRSNSDTIRQHIEIYNLFFDDCGVTQYSVASDTHN